MDDTLIFMDANRYLQIYRIPAGRKLLPAIKAQQQHIFVTKQVVDEVQRNKLRETARLVDSQIEQLNRAERCTILPKDVRVKIRAAKATFTATAVEKLKQVSRSEDEVSEALADLFKMAVSASTAELERARSRKEKGNPPGKQSDPLGDQLTWEQLLSHAKGKSRVWIISSDGDYCVAQNGKRFLNSFLHEELAALNTPPTQVFFFDDIDDAVRDFVQRTGIKTDALPTLEESLEIKEEIAAEIEEERATELPVGWLSNASVMDATTAVMHRFTELYRNPTMLALSRTGGFTPGMPPDDPKKAPEEGAPDEPQTRPEEPSEE